MPVEAEANWICLLSFVTQRDIRHDDTNQDAYFLPRIPSRLIDTVCINRRGTEIQDAVRCFAAIINREMIPKFETWGLNLSYAPSSNEQVHCNLKLSSGFYLMVAKRVTDKVAICGDNACTGLSSGIEID